VPKLFSIKTAWQCQMAGIKIYPTCSNRHFLLDQVIHAANIMNSVLYVNKARYGSNGKIVPTGLFLLAAKYTLPK